MNINWFIALSSFSNLDGPSVMFCKIFTIKPDKKIFLINEVWNILQSVWVYYESSKSFVTALVFKDFDTENTT